MIAFSSVQGHRVVASPDVLDAALWPHACWVLRLAADELLLLDDTAADSVMPTVADPFAIIEAESGFCEGWCDRARFDEIVRPHIDWAIPSTRPAFTQGLVAGVPCKLWFADEGILILCSTSHVHELEARL